MYFAVTNNNIFHSEVDRSMRYGRINVIRFWIFLQPKLEH